MSIAGNNHYSRGALVSFKPRLYAQYMSSDVGSIMGARFRALRERLGGTQEAFSERSGLTQVRISRLERGLGYKQLQEIVNGIERAGGDPLDLLSGTPPADPVVAEIRRLVDELGSDDAREHILSSLRREVQHQRQQGQAVVKVS
ncbi:MAG: transcriptional regulator with XRE-family HTH domain [Myxococcota bacterium]